MSKTVPSTPPENANRSWLPTPIQHLKSAFLAIPWSYRATFWVMAIFFIVAIGWDLLWSMLHQPKNVIATINEAANLPLGLKDGKILHPETLVSSDQVLDMYKEQRQSASQISERLWDLVKISFGVLIGGLTTMIRVQTGDDSKSADAGSTHDTNGEPSSPQGNAEPR